jgi:hypothetical protein
MVDGDLFEDCPSVAIGYIREPDRIEIRYVNPAAHPAEPAADARARTRTRTRTRIRRSLPPLAPTRSPDGRSPTPGSASPAGSSTTPPTPTLRSAPARAPPPSLSVDAVAAFYRQQLDSQAHQDTLNARRPEYDRITVWKPDWIPVVSHGVADRTSGLYLDAATGYLGPLVPLQRSPRRRARHAGHLPGGRRRHARGPGPGHAGQAGLIGGALVWGSRLDSVQEERWQPLTG